MLTTAPLLFLLLLLAVGEVVSLVTHACEGNHVKIMCPMYNQVIVVGSATYGRPSDPPGHPGRCGDHLVVRRRCEKDITPLMKFRCEGQAGCEVYVDVATFGVEMCIDVMKYAEVHYDCVSFSAMDTIQRCSQKCMPTVGAAAGGGAGAGAARPPHVFGSSYGQSGTPTQISGPASRPASNAVAPATASLGQAPAPPAAAASASSHTKTSIPAPLSLNAPSLPYETVGGGIAAAFSRGSTGTGTTKSASARAQTNAPLSAALRASFQARLRRMLEALRNRKSASG